ncbi:hypothetical protein EVJ32_05115 [Exiguobacterium sp. SH5S4]|uniref:phage tail protein n=1 Tax=Exiguobacterium sp. SH5S4 TaxID=2510961 RepID=UPI00104081BF|nr:phage tail protein [Exiguobacterium sp. SH5S4]TCI26758.1 hypothetical protein EVJ32_05115 [Exiguobacterium sp. SH5S4]
MYFDIKQRNTKPILYLAKPDRTTIARLSEARQETESFNGGQLNELSFVLPLKHQTLEENKKNLHAEMIRERMVIKLHDKETDKDRYYVITGFNFDMDALTVSVSCKLNPYTLSDIPIKGFTTIDNEHPDGLDYSSWTLSEIVRATIDRDEDTPWRLGDVDSEFDLKRREFTFDGSLGELAVQVAQKFGAVLEYDDTEYLIHFRNPETLGRNRGLKISERNYMKSLTKDTNADNMVTQLALYGKDGLTIHEVSPTGSPYIEDFSYFLYPYEEDEQGNIVKSSYFMSDSLAQAMVAYNRKLSQLTPTFDSLVVQLDGLMAQVSEQNDMLADLDIELTQAQERVDIHLALNNGQSNPEYEADKIRILEAKNVIESVVLGLKEDISDIAGADYYELGFVVMGASGGQIGLLKEQMLIRNNFTPAQIAERSHFIIRKEWTNDSIVEAKDLLEEGRKELKELIKPNINLNVGLVDFLSMVEIPDGHKDFRMWDEIRIEEPWNRGITTARITGIVRNYDTKELTVTITNVKDSNDGTNKFLEMLYQSSFAATVVNENRFKWDLSKENNGQINALIEQNFDAVKKKVSGGVAGLTEFSARGLTSRDYEDNRKYLVVQNGVLATTNDDGVTWGHAITPTGIVGERIFGKIIAGVNLTIEDEDGIFRILGNKASISNRLGEEVVKLGLVTDEGEDERFGLVVDNRKNQVGIIDGEGFYISRYQGGNLEKLLWTDANGNLNTQKITATQMTVVNGDLASAVVKNSAGIPVVSFGTFGMDIDGGSISIAGGANGIRLNDAEGLVSENSKTKVTLNATDGIKIRNKNTAKDVFWVDSNGKLNVRDIVINSGSISWGGVNSQPMPDVSWESMVGKPTYLDSDRIWSPLIQGGLIEGGTLSAGTITGGTITGNTITGSTISGTTISGTTITSGSAYNKIEMSNSEIYTYYQSGSESSTTKLADGRISFSNTYNSSTRSGYIRLNPFSGTSNNYTSEFEINTTCDILTIYAPAINLYPTNGAASAMLRGNAIATRQWVLDQGYSSSGGSNDYATESWVSSNYASRYHSHSQYAEEGTTVYFNAIGVGGSYQNTINPSNTIINVNNIAVPGMVYAQGTRLTSSVTFKTNIKPLQDGAISVLKDVNIYEYYYQSDVDDFNFDNRQIGILAEAVPEILRGGENKAVNPYAMTSVLWKAVQEQQTLIETLEARIADLEEIQ